VRTLIALTLCLNLNATALWHTSNQQELINAIITVESSGNDYAVGDTKSIYGPAYGPLQITIGVIADVNSAYKTTFTHKDAFKRKRATVIFRAYVALYATRKRIGRDVTIRDVALVWHDGSRGWEKGDPSGYWTSVSDALRYNRETRTRMSR